MEREPDQGSTPQPASAELDQAAAPAPEDALSVPHAQPSIERRRPNFALPLIGPVGLVLIVATFFYFFV